MVGFLCELPGNGVLNGWFSKKWGMNLEIRPQKLDLMGASEDLRHKIGRFWG